MNLNLGCGTDDYGDIRLDIDYHTQIGEESKLNIRADAHYLPFKDKTFDECRCWHVLEHVDNPNRVLSEIDRVSNHYSIRFPVDDGYTKRMLVGILNLDYATFISGYKTMKGRVHKHIIKSKNAIATDQYIPFPLARFFLNGRKSRFLKWLISKYYFEMEITK